MFSLCFVYECLIVCEFYEAMCICRLLWNSYEGSVVVRLKNLGGLCALVGLYNGWNKINVCYFCVDNVKQLFNLLELMSTWIYLKDKFILIRK